MYLKFFVLALDNLENINLTLFYLKFWGTDSHFCHTLNGFTQEFRSSIASITPRHKIFLVLYILLPSTSPAITLTQTESATVLSCQWKKKSWEASQIKQHVVRCIFIIMAEKIAINLEEFRPPSPRPLGALCADLAIDLL